MTSPPNLFMELEDLAYLHPTAIVGRTVRLRKPDRVRIHAGSIIDDFTYVSAGLTVGRYTHIGAHAAIIGGDAHVSIGDFVNMAPGCRLIAASNDFSGGGLAGPTIPATYASDSIIEDITLSDHVLLGAQVVVLPGTRIPEGVAAGACTLLSSRIVLEPWTVYVGNPARPIKVRERFEICAAAERLRKEHPNDFEQID